MEYHLSIGVFGTGEDPQHRSHWGFVIHHPTCLIGDLLHVELLDLDTLWYEFEMRFKTDLAIRGAQGLSRITTLDPLQRNKAIEVIKSEPAPRDGQRRCQDWVFSTLIALEVEELVPPGTAEFWKSMIALPAREVRKARWDRWTSLINV